MEQLPEPKIGQVWRSPPDSRCGVRSVVYIDDVDGTKLIAFRRRDPTGLEYARKEQFLKWARRAGAKPE